MFPDLLLSSLPSVQSLVAFHGAHFVAPHFDALANLVTDALEGTENFFIVALNRRWIGKAPVQSPGDTGKYRTAFGAGLVADCDDVGEKFA